jgi:hypothetical protein
MVTATSSRLTNSCSENDAELSHRLGFSAQWTFYANSFYGAVFVAYWRCESKRNHSTNFALKTAFGRTT